eukprot:320442-Chlamydomonas_euryale.AAC.1
MRAGVPLCVSLLGDCDGRQPALHRDDALHKQPDGPGGGVSGWLPATATGAGARRRGGREGNSPGRAGEGEGGAG